LIDTELDIQNEIYTTINRVPGSIAVLSKLGDHVNVYANYDVACVGQKAREEARELRQDLFKIKVHLFELEFHPEPVIFRDEEQKSEH
jgi:hypothetical protein